MDVSVIIVNYNTADLIAQCIDAVLAQQNITLEIIVVDNASSDNSIDTLKLYSDKVRLIVNAVNVGFGKANNQAFQISQGKFVFLLNPDAKLVAQNTIEKLKKVLDESKQYGIVGPCVKKENKISCPQKYYPGEKHLKYSLQGLPGEIAWIIGASMMIRREVYETIKGFDEDYFLYGEEADLCLRARKAGWQIGYDENIVVEHIGGASERQTRLRDYWTKKQSGAILFYRKHYGSVDAARLIKRDYKTAQRKLFFLAVFKNREKQERYEAIREVCYSALRFLRD